MHTLETISRYVSTQTTREATIKDESNKQDRKQDCVGDDNAVRGNGLSFQNLFVTEVSAYKGRGFGIKTKTQ